VARLEINTLSLTLQVGRIVFWAQDFKDPQKRKKLEIRN
jgi:hypothetical protein